MRLYLAGPMAGIHNFNRDAFDWVASKLRARGEEVVSPAEFDDIEHEPSSDPWTVDARSRATYLERDFGFVLGVDGIVLLPGWETSTGANAELWVARVTGKLVYRWEDDLVAPDGTGGLVYDPDSYPSDALLQTHMRSVTRTPLQAVWYAAAVDQLRNAILGASGRRSS